MALGKFELRRTSILLSFVTPGFQIEVLKTKFREHNDLQTASEVSQGISKSMVKVKKDTAFVLPVRISSFVSDE